MRSKKFKGIELEMDSNDAVKNPKIIGKIIGKSNIFVLKLSPKFQFHLFFVNFVPRNQCRLNSWWKILMWPPPLYTSMQIIQLSTPVKSTLKMTILPPIIHLDHLVSKVKGQICHFKYVFDAWVNNWIYWR